MFCQLTILKSILVAILMIKHHPHLDLVRILIVYYECILLQLLLVYVSSTDNTEEYPSSNTDDKTPPSSVHG